MPETKQSITRQENDVKKEEKILNGYVISNLRNLFDKGDT